MSNLMDKITRSQTKRETSEQFGKLCFFVKEGNAAQVRKILSKAKNVDLFFSMVGRGYQIRTILRSRNLRFGGIKGKWLMCSPSLIRILRKRL